MSNSNEDNAADTARRIDDLFSTLRAALSADVSSDARSNALNACRTILNGLENGPPRNGAPTSSPATMFAGSPIGKALGAFGSMPREQMFELFGVVRSLFSAPAPSYRAKPPSTTPREPGGQS